MAASNSASAAADRNTTDAASVVTTVIRLPSAQFMSTRTFSGRVALRWVGAIGVSLSEVPKLDCAMARAPATDSLTTPRLHLRPFTEDDAPFVLTLLNDPDWLRFIGDNGTRTLDDARAYLREGPLAMYAAHGFGLLAVDLRDTGETVGMCGLIRREGVADVDLGFAFLPAHRGQGLAREAAAAALDHGHRMLGIRRIVGYVAPGNARSARLLEAIGMQPAGTTTLPGSPEPLLMFSSVATGPAAGAGSGDAGAGDV